MESFLIEPLGKLIPPLQQMSVLFLARKGDGMIAFLQSNPIWFLMCFLILISQYLKDQVKLDSDSQIVVLLIFLND